MEGYHNNQLVGTIALCHPTYYRSQLVGTTALCHPTHHKSIGLRTVIAVAASIAIPIAAPAIASSIGLSAAIGSATIASAVVGGVLGAGVAAITGANPLIGALGGAAAGGIAGFNAPVASTPGVATTGPAPAHISSSALAPTQTPAGLTTVIRTDAGPLVVPATTQTVVPNNVLASKLSGSTAQLRPEMIDATQTVVPNNVLASKLSSSTHPNISTGGTIAVPTHGLTPEQVAQFGSSAGNTASSVVAKPSFLDSLKSKIPDVFTSGPVKQGVAKSLANILADIGAGDEPHMTPEEQRLSALLASDRELQARQLAKQVEIGDQLFGTAKRIDPPAIAQRTHAEKLIQLGRLRQDQLRKIPSHASQLARAGVRRRSQLDAFLAASAAHDRTRNEQEVRKASILANTANALATGEGIGRDRAFDLAAEAGRRDRLTKARQAGVNIITPITHELFGANLEDLDDEREDTSNIG